MTASAYTHEMFERFGRLAAWPVNDPITLGAVGTLNQDYQFSRETSLQNLGVPFVVLPPGPAANYEHKTEASVEVSFKAAGDTPAVGSALTKVEAGATLSFSRAKSVYFRADGVTIEKIDDLEPIKALMLKGWQDGSWPMNKVVVVEVYRATSATLLISTKANTQVEISATAQVGAGTFSLASVEAGLRVVADRSSSTQILSQAGTTPLLRVLRLRRWGLNQPVPGVELAETAEVTVEDVDPTESLFNQGADAPVSNDLRVRAEIELGEEGENPDRRDNPENPAIEAIASNRSLAALAAPPEEPMDPWFERRYGMMAREALEKIIGDDDRVPVSPITGFPWAAVCSLEMTAADGRRFIGTGWLISPTTVITAGHCVYMHEHGGWASSIRVHPGRDGDTKAFGSFTAKRLWTVRGWIDSESRDHDYGAIILSTPVDVSKTGVFGFSTASDTDLNGFTCNLAGYPGDKPSGTQWFHARKLTGVAPRVLTYDIDTMGGQSGAPVWRKTGDKRIALGIHTNGATSGNSATRIALPVFMNLRSWRYDT